MTNADKANGFLDGNLAIIISSAKEVNAFLNFLEEKEYGYIHHQW